VRIGFLSFGGGGADTALVEALRARDIDVVVADESAVSGVIAVREAARLSRADCDGVAFFVEPGAVADYVAQAALHIGCPVLLVGPFASVFFDAIGALAEIGVPFDRDLLAYNDIDRITVWLTANRKTERQRGIEAAQKLYGQTLLLPSQANTWGSFDPAQWKRQFGVTIIWGHSEEADFHAPDGDVNGALTVRLLSLISGADVRTCTVDELLHEDEQTFARITRRVGRFICVLSRRQVTRVQFALTLMSSRLHSVPGDHVAAMRAACEALDVEVITPSGGE
jgi:hypothetical protein